MRTLFLVITVLFLTSLGYSQQAKYQTYKSVMKLNAFKDGQNYQWENKNITVVLDYQLGNFIAKLKNSDFYYTTPPPASDADSVQREKEYEFKGIFPIREIINQKQINQTYNVELQLVNWDLSLDNTVNFELQVMNPGTNQANYRVFQLYGKMYNYELNLPAFTGFDNEIEVWILFNGYMINP